MTPNSIASSRGLDTVLPMTRIGEEAVAGGLFGVCTGDAMGLPVEGVSRSYLKRYPVRGIGYQAPFRGVSPGFWSDDSSLTICLAESLISGFNLKDIALRFCRWLYEGYWTPSGTAFGIGRTTLEAIERLREGVEPERAGGRGVYDNGNGSLMRILPLAFHLVNAGTEECFAKIHGVSSLTHAHPRSLIACGIYVLFAVHLMRQGDRRGAFEEMKKDVLEHYGGGPDEKELLHFERILHGDIAGVPEKEIRSSGYVVDTLEASLWCFMNGTGFQDTLLTAVNLGGDSDTTGAVTGGMAGLYYGFGAITVDWVKGIARKDDIMELSRKLSRATARS